MGRRRHNLGPTRAPGRASPSERHPVLYILHYRRKDEHNGVMAVTSFFASWAGYQTSLPP
eukprot:scaffold44913_cov56-Phaeocystis_antarctica.AAC.3